MHLHIYKDADELSSSVADWITEYVRDTLGHNQRFTVALSGGSTPRKLHDLLAAAPYREMIDWKKMHFFWGDERAVPFGDERNNAKMAFDTLLDKVPVKQENIHIIRTDIDPVEAAGQYEKTLRGYFDDTGTTFDLVLLGMGDDGHTLSLFPGYDIVQEEERWADAFYLEEQEMDRITLTAPVVNRAAKVAFLVAGGGKAKALQQVIEGKYEPEIYPSQRISPVSGELYWFLDEAAASLLEK